MGRRSGSPAGLIVTCARICHAPPQAAQAAARQPTQSRSLAPRVFGNLQRKHTRRRPGRQQRGKIKDIAGHLADLLGAVAVIDHALDVDSDFPRRMDSGHEFRMATVGKQAGVTMSPTVTVFAKGATCSGTARR